MVYYVQTRDGKILKGKANTWNEVWKIKMWAALEGPHFRHIVSGVKNAQCADDTVIISHFGKKSIVF